MSTYKAKYMAPCIEVIVLDMETGVMAGSMRRSSHGRSGKHFSRGNSSRGISLRQRYYKQVSKKNKRR